MIYTSTCISSTMQTKELFLTLAKGWPDVGPPPASRNSPPKGCASKPFSLASARHGKVTRCKMNSMKKPSPKAWPKAWPKASPRHLSPSKRPRNQP